MASSFEWDSVKAASNLAKHRFSFNDAIEVFRDARIVVVSTNRERDEEERFKAVGQIDGKVFTVVYTTRAEVVRLISARRANAAEEKLYGRGPQDAQPK